MQTTGVIRPVDRMGRVVIPKEIRRQLKIENDKDSFEIYMEGDKIILKKYHPTCIFCDSFIKNHEYNGYNVCEDCIGKLEELKNNND